LTPAAGRKDCYTYKAVAGDYPEGLASRLDIPVQQLLLDNLDVIKDPSTLPAGTTLLLCNISSAVAAGGLSSRDSVAPSNISASRDDVAALLAIKRVLDPPGTALKDWQPGSANPCNWTGVICDGSSQRVTNVNFWDAAAQKAKVQLSGQLPSGALLRRLPGLVTIAVHGTGVGGPLPEDWFQLGQLEEVYLSSNKLTGGLWIERQMFGTTMRVVELQLKMVLNSGQHISNIHLCQSANGTCLKLAQHDNTLSKHIPPCYQLPSDAI
jgi:hypothetical protein